MNQTERIAFEWLKNKGYKEQEILFRSSKTPDFVCNDGKRYEVKLAYSNQILFSKSQIKYLKDGDYILVFNNRDFMVDEFLWKNRNKSKFTIKVIDYMKNRRILKISAENQEWLVDLKFENRCRGIDEVLSLIKKNLKSKKLK